MVYAAIIRYVNNTMDQSAVKNSEGINKWSSVP